MKDSQCCIFYFKIHPKKIKFSNHMMFEDRSHLREIRDVLPKTVL